MKPLFVTGTDTGIGKTVLSLVLVQWFIKKGYRPFYLKPIQTGCVNPNDTNSDARFVYSHVPGFKGNDLEESVVYCFTAPKAPLFAAREADVRIDMDRIMHAINTKTKTFSPVIVEGAGGLMVPITNTLLMIDMIKMAGAIPILAARAGLGTINHTLLSISQMDRSNIPPEGIILINPDGDISKRMIRENIEAIEMISGKKVLGVIGKIDDFSSLTDDNIRGICYRIEQTLNNGRHNY